MENTALKRARREYADVEARYVDSLRAKGLKFAERGADAEECRRLRDELAARGVAVRNAGASLSVGHLSPACVECTGKNGSETFSTTFKCHRDCYFCFNKNQADYERFFREGCPWEEGLERCRREHDTLGCIGLTGGEPLLDIDDSIAFLERAGELFPGAHKRMYTSGDLLTAESAARLRDAGLDEIRFSVKDDDSPEQQAKVLAAMELAKGYIPSVMVEMPVIPGAEEHMKALLREFDRIGIDGINLLEFCFPFSNWHEFDKRGLVLKNPPFEVMYDYGYSGGLAVAGSEALILRLMLWALDEGIGIGMHYCSLENKHRSEIRIKNERIASGFPMFAFDEGDFFLKVGKVFGPDVEPARAALEACGCEDVRVEGAGAGEGAAGSGEGAAAGAAPGGAGGDDTLSLAFPLRFMDALSGVVREDGSPIEPQVCYYVYECDDEGAYLIDAALELP